MRACSPGRRKSGQHDADKLRPAVVNRSRVRHIVEYPLSLLGAAAAARQLRRKSHLSPEAALAFARSFRWYRGTNISPTQQDSEILGLLRYLSERPPRTVV